VPLATVTVTGTILDASQQPLNGQVTFTPINNLTDAAGNPVPGSVTDRTDAIVIPMTGVAVQLNRGKFSVALVPTDVAGLIPAGWQYQVTISIPGIPDYSFTTLLPSTPNPTDLSALSH
jgi:hypothetical protein